MARLRLRLATMLPMGLASVAVDDTKIGYASEWDIDQLVATADVAVGSGDTAIYTITGSLPAIPVYEVQFQPGGSGPFYQAGAYSTDGTLANTSSFSTYISAGQIFITAFTTGVARYYVWSDKVDH